MSKEKNPRFTSPRGVAGYPYLTKPDTKFNPEGEYKVDLLIKDPTDVAKMTDLLDEQFEVAFKKAKAEAKGAKVKEGSRGYEEQEDGSIKVRFKLKASGKRKDGTEFTQKPALFNAKGEPLKADKVVGSGSTIKVSFEVVPFYTKLAGAGITLRMKAVQVIKLESYAGGDASSYGFEAEEGGDEDEDQDSGGSDFESEDSDNTENEDF